MDSCSFMPKEAGGLDAAMGTARRVGACRKPRDVTFRAGASQPHLHLQASALRPSRMKPRATRPPATGQLFLRQQDDLHHPWHDDDRLLRRPRAPALPADRARRDNSLPGQRREVHWQQWRRALDQLLDGIRRRGRHACGEQRRDRLDQVFPQGPPRLDLRHHRRVGRRLGALELRRVG